MTKLQQRIIANIHQTNCLSNVNGFKLYRFILPRVDKSWRLRRLLTVKYFHHCLALYP